MRLYYSINQSVLKILIAIILTVVIIAGLYGVVVFYWVLFGNHVTIVTVTFNPYSKM